MDNNETSTAGRPKYVRDAQLTKYVPFCISKARKISALAGARVKVGEKGVLNDLDRIYAYIDGLAD